MAPRADCLHGDLQGDIDDFLEDPGDQTEDEFVISLFFTVGPHFEPVEQAIANMAPDVRARMAETGCIDEETSGAVPVEPERTEVPVGGSVDGELAEPGSTGFLQFEAAMGRNTSSKWRGRAFRKSMWSSRILRIPWWNGSRF